MSNLQMILSENFLSTIKENKEKKIELKTLCLLNLAFPQNFASVLKDGFEEMILTN